VPIEAWLSRRASSEASASTLNMRGANRATGATADWSPRPMMRSIAAAT
jgi:hypothetical protein